jgi:hypothetical protein
MPMRAIRNHSTAWAKCRPWCKPREIRSSAGEIATFQLAIPYDLIRQLNEFAAPLFIGSDNWPFLLGADLPVTDRLDK